MIDLNEYDDVHERRLPWKYGDTYIWRSDHGSELHVFRGNSGRPRLSMPVEYVYGVWSFRAVKR